MAHEMDGSDLKERLALIENMLAEGRRSTESWGWSFVLWGVAYYIAVAWATWGHSNLAWPVTMTAAGILTGIGASRVSKGHPETTLGRAVGGVWIAVGISLMVVTMSLAWAGRYDGHVFIAAIGGMLCSANGASAIILKWKAQFVCAAIWLAAAVIAAFGSDEITGYVFLGATFFGQIVFGIYAMICDSRRRKQAEVAHA